MNCGQKIVDACVGSKFWVDRLEDGTLCSSFTTKQVRNDCIVGRWADFMGELVYVAQFLIIFMLTTASSSLSRNTVRGLNALRCAIASGGINAYNLLAAVYFAAKQFGQETEIQFYLNEYWPYVCTCIDDVDAFSEMMGGDQSTANEFKTCN